MSDSDSDMEDAQRNSDGILESDLNSQVSDEGFKGGTIEAEVCPALAVASSMNTLLALMQTMKLTSAEPKLRYSRPASIMRETCRFSQDNSEMLLR